MKTEKHSRKQKYVQIYFSCEHNCAIWMILCVHTYTLVPTALKAVKTKSQTNTGTLETGIDSK